MPLDIAVSLRFNCRTQPSAVAMTLDAWLWPVRRH